MLQNPWLHKPPRFTGQSLDDGALPDCVAEIVKRKLGDDWHRGFGYVSAVFVGKNSVLKFDRFPGRTGRFNHDRAVSRIEVSNFATTKIVDEGVTDGYEWIEQSVVPGRPAYQVWPQMSDSRREALIEDVALCISSIQHLSLDQSLVHSQFDDW